MRLLPGKLLRPALKSAGGGTGGDAPSTRAENPKKKAGDLGEALPPPPPPGTPKKKPATRGEPLPPPPRLVHSSVAMACPARLRRSSQSPMPAEPRNSAPASQSCAAWSTATPPPARAKMAVCGR